MANRREPPTREERIKSLRLRLAHLRLLNVQNRHRRGRWAREDRMSRDAEAIRISNELAELEKQGGPNAGQDSKG